MEDFEIPRLRPLQDFLLESARFSTPALNDPQRFSNRVIDNLLYYQANYFLTAILVFLLVGFFYPKDLSLGLLTVVVIFVAFMYFTNNERETEKFKQNHPFLCLIGILGIAYLFMYLFGSMLVFLWGIYLPLTLIFLHASFE